MINGRRLLETLPKRCPKAGARRAQHILSGEKRQVGLVLAKHGVLALWARVRRLLPMVLLGWDRAIGLAHLLNHLLRRRVMQVIASSSRSPCCRLCNRKA